MTTATKRTHTAVIQAAANRLGITTDQYQARRDAGLKWCRACQDWHPLADYKPSTSTYDGLRPLCTRHYATPQPPVDHGLTRYRYHGCRCDTCRTANTAEGRKQKQRRMAQPDSADRAGHGKSTTYGNYGCRCAPCKAAQSDKNRAYRELRQQRQQGEAS